jgi:hypothetical protein
MPSEKMPPRRRIRAPLSDFVGYSPPRGPVRMWSNTTCRRTRHRRCCSWGDWRFHRFRCGRENGDVDAGSAISVLTCLSVFIWKWVDPIHDLMGPNGCSTVWRRRRIFAGLRSSLACTASRTASCSQHDIRRSFPVVVLDPGGSTSSAGRLRLQTSAFLHSLGQKRS